MRAVELGRRTEDAPEAVASVLIDRLVGVVSLVVLAVIAVALGGHAAGGRGWSPPRRRSALAAAAVARRCSSRAGCAAWWRAGSSRASAGRRLAVGQRFYDALHAYRDHRAHAGRRVSCWRWSCSSPGWA